jgi:tRNA G26 N,N-dimethylase Trm1
MSTIDQLTVDHLYSEIFSQWRRYNYFDTCGSAAGVASVWSKRSNEKQVLEAFVNHYKNYYVTRAEKLKDVLETQKDLDIASYLTYDVESYVNRYVKDVSDIDEYIEKVVSNGYDEICTESLCSISQRLDDVFPGYMKDPTLLGKLHLL